MDQRFYQFDEEETIDIKSFIIKCFHHWPYFVIILVIALTIAFLVNKFTSPVYKVKTWILIRDEENPLDPQKFIGSSLYGNPYKLENEIGILKSKQLTEKTIKELNFLVSYYQDERFKSTSLYTHSPFIIQPDTLFRQPVNVSFQLLFLSDTLMVVKSEAENVMLYDYTNRTNNSSLQYFQFCDTLSFGQIAGNQYCRFLVLPNFNQMSRISEHKKYSFQFNSIGQLVNQFRNTDITSSKSSSILEISIKCSNVEQGVDYLNKLASFYLQKSIERDDRIATTTLEFIDDQLEEISDSLRFSEDRLQHFKTSKKVMNLDFQAQQIYQQMENLQNQKAQLVVKSKYYQYLKEYLEKNTNIDELIAPSSMDINDPLLNSLIMELSKLSSERTEMSFNTIRDNPYLNSLESKIADIRAKLLENVDNIVKSSAISLQETDTRIVNLEGTINKLPKEQREYFVIERKFKFNDAIYTFLLTKRSEVQISKASNLPSNEILDPASYDDYMMISPNMRLNYIIALLLGFFVPVAFIYLKDFFRNKIDDKKDIQRITDVPILGNIIHNKYKTSTVVRDYPMSLIAESFRSLRTNFQFIADESEKNIVLISSVTTGEGKSFTAVNLGTVFAQNQKKVAVIDFDLRKSKIKQYLDIETNEGLSMFLSNHAELNAIIFPSGIENLDIIPSGPIPPNPTELISSARTTELFLLLKRSYDIIFIDSPPVGLVSDALLLLKHANVIMLVLRHNFTPKSLFSNIMDDLARRKIENINLLINDIKLNMNGYGYGYGYAYGYGYDNHETKSPGKRLTGLFRGN
jgi:tyrosine-protein kinase Etk/Wzc